MHEDSTEEEEMRRQQSNEGYERFDEEKLNQKEGLDAENRWWVAGSLAVDCEKAWLHPGEEETMHKWFVWCGENEKRKMIERKMEELHQQRCESDYQECGRQC